MNPASEAYLKRIVRESVQETLTSMGFSTHAPHELQADMFYLRKARLGSDEVAKWVRRTTITVGVTGMLYSLWQGVRLAIR